MSDGYDLSRKAVADLRGIWAYTEERWGAAQAELYYRAIIDRISALASGLAAGRPSPDREGYFFAKQGHHFIFYTRAADGRLFVSRILHEAMDLPSHLSQ